MVRIMVEEEYEEEYVEENKKVMGLLEKAMMQLKKEENPKIVYHPAPDSRYTAPWKFMSDFGIPFVLICDDLQNGGAPNALALEQWERDNYPDYLEILHYPIDGKVIRDEFSSAYYDSQLNYENRLIYRGDTHVHDGIEDIPFFDVVYIDFKVYLPTPNADRIPRCANLPQREDEDVLIQVVEYCHHIRDGGLLLLEHYIMDPILCVLPKFRYTDVGDRASNRFGSVEIEYLGEYRLNLDESPRDNIEVFKIHSELEFEDPSEFLAKCFVGINLD